MWHVRRRHDDVTGPRVDAVVANGERRLTLLDDEVSVYGWLCRPGPSPGSLWVRKNETGAAWSSPSKRYEFPLSGSLSVRTIFTAQG
jgi:hypothetical protein